MEAPRLNRSYWLEGAGPAYPALSGQVSVDAAVIGAGITGVTVAHLLKRAGKTVALLESAAVGYGATGYTTAKLTVGHSLVYRDLVDSFDVSVARGYARSNQQAIEQVEGLVREHAIECDFESAANYVYTESAAKVEDLERELDAAREAGVEAALTTETDLPYSVRAAIRVDDQAQFHPWKYIAALARLLPGEGSHVFESTRATDVRSGDPCVVETPSGTVRARHVVVATQLPFLDRGLFFAKAHPTKSYVVAATVDEAPRGMYISVDQPTRSVRSTPAADGRRVLIVGGEGHKPGADPNTDARYGKLEDFMRDRFGGAAAEYRWSTHDYVPVDKLPYIGRLRRGDDRVLTATGFAKWGMTKGTLAATILADAILGRPNEWAELYDANRLDVRQSALRFAKENAEVGFRFFRDRVRARDRRSAVERLAPGEGMIARIGIEQYAVARDDDGQLHTLSARCTHLGCIVGWNPADRAWECPCHGSRFAADGTVVQGPATADLPARTLPRLATGRLPRQG
jgi:glycine/D-amino acid oxidase-like deaminating enzyme/nitrite reductase/ring-hydroxylating ferredoxin subunit